MDESREEDDMVVNEKQRRHEEELKKISSGIGKVVHKIIPPINPPCSCHHLLPQVFLDTIRKTERIRSARGTTIDPRSAARTPAANRSVVWARLDL